MTNEYRLSGGGQILECAMHMAKQEDFAEAKVLANDFLEAVNKGVIAIITVKHISTVRIASYGRNSEVTIFLPEEVTLGQVISGIVDSVFELGHPSGPGMYEVQRRKQKMKNELVNLYT